MMADLLQAAGGIGLFLLGMALLTDGLRSLAGDRLRNTLAVFTSNRLTGAVAGALTTAVIQSSSATTMIAIGLVGAGLMSFANALGIIFGANIGTTLTGWVVAFVGFKIELGLFAAPIVLAGALLRILTGGRFAPAGTCLAGFGLLFVGIDMMQAGLASLEGIVTPERFPADTLAGRLQLVLIGMLVTTVTQSSSAGVATALVALDGGAISFEQACAMVIGMDVGTTFKALVVVAGGSIEMRRTGYAHVIYNVATGILAFAILPLYVLFMSDGPGSGTDRQFALVAFHTFFNVAGVILVLPVAGLFAKLVIRLVPGRDAALADRLDAQLLASPPAAIDAAFGTVRAVAASLVGDLRRLLAAEDGEPFDPADAARLRDALAATRLYIERIRPDTRDAALLARYRSVLHAIDHLQRLVARCQQEDRIRTLRQDRRLQRLAGLLREMTAGFVPDHDETAALARLDRLREILHRQRHAVRDATIAAAARAEISGADALSRLDAVRWLHRSAYHLWRIAHHLAIAGQAAPTGAAAASLSAEDAEPQPGVR